ncbi:MAG TPA: ABC transporter substrate-binding protein [Actinomycetota bacterium]|nr:ABC transporter substrate-binding protein [Actinomycetota bacterium]
MRSTWRRLLALVAGAVLMTAGIGQIALAQDTGAGGTDEKVTFTFGSTGEPLTMNPMSGYLAIEFYFWTASYHLLIDWDQNLGVDDGTGPGSGLVTDVQVSDDGMTYTYKIKSGIMWSDGEPLTAEDVAFTLNLYKGNHAYLPQNYLTLIDGDVRAVDDTTIEFDTVSPTSLYSGNVAYMYDYILPKHIWDDPSVVGEHPKQFDNVPNVGSGPFVIEEFKTGEYIRMVQNPYWTGPKPAVDEIIYRIFKNEDALSEALKQGEIDFAYVTSANIYNDLAAQPDIETMAGTIPSFSEIGMNTGSAYQEKDDYFTPHGDGHPALTDVTVRRAIRMAIDSNTLTDKVLQGYGLPGDSIIPPVSVEGARWEPEGEDVIPFDLTAAAQLLEDAGYVDSDGDGVREMPPGSLDPGRPLEFRYYVRSNEQTSVDASQYIKPWLEEIGIKANVEVVSSGRLGDIINEGTYDLFSWGWIPDPDPDSALSWFTCDSRPPDGSSYGNNDSYYCNPEYDAMYEQQRTTTDPDERWQIVHEMQRIYYEDAAYAVMWYDPVLSAWRGDRFTGYVPQPEPNGDPLESWGGPSSVWWTIKPIGAGGGGTVEARGFPAAAWIGIAAGVVIIIAAIVLGRRRRSEEEEA